MRARRNASSHSPLAKPTQSKSKSRSNAVVRHPLVEIRPRHRIEPFHQGDLDTLCGLYAIINGLRLASEDIQPLTMRESRKLFAAGIAYLDRKKGLYEAVTDGLYVRRYLALARCLAKLASSPTRQCSIERAGPNLVSIDDVFDWVRLSLFDNQPVLVPLMDSLNHLTVVAGLSEKLAYVFDSTGQQHVRKLSCDLSGRLHKIPLNGPMRISITL